METGPPRRGRVSAVRPHLSQPLLSWSRTARRLLRVLLDPHALGDDHDPALGHVEALLVGFGIEADHGVGRDLHVLVDDRALDAAVAADGDALEEDGLLHRAV